MPERTLREDVARIVRRRLRRLLSRAEDAVTSGRDDELHALRIEVKRLRYNLEFFRRLLDESSSANALEMLARVQERLGTIADADAFERCYDELLDQLEPPDSRIAGLEARRSAAQLERERALEGLRALWNGESPAYPERLAASISAALGSTSPKEAG